MQLDVKMLSGMAKVKTERSLIWVYTVCICHIVRHFGVQTFRTFAVCTIGHVSVVKIQSVH